MGGTGNNLFQIAAAVGIAEKLNTDYSIPQWEQAWAFSGEFNTSQMQLPRFHEPAFHFSEINQDEVELFGYFQSEKYFSNCRNKIKTIFSPSLHISETIKYKYESLVKKYNTCSVHVRRNDYLKLSEYHYNLEKEYYTKIMQMFPDLYYVCFSDDIEWCKENIPAHEFINDKTEVEFHLMSMMKHNIIANSSFSWWASWLNRNDDKMIFAPPKHKWFGEKKKHLNVNDLYCDNWIYEGCPTR